MFKRFPRVELTPARRPGLLRRAATKAISWLGWRPGEEGLWSLAAGTTSADRTKYAAEIGDVLKTPIVMASIKWITRTIHEAPLHEVRRNSSGRVVGRKGRSLVLDLIRRPNDYYRGKSMFAGLGASWNLSGNAYLIKQRDDFRRVNGLWYEPHFTIRPRYYNDGVFDSELIARPDGKFVSFYEVYRPNNGTRKDWQRVEVEDVIHFRDGTDPRNPRLGINGLASLIAEIYTDMQRAHFSATVLSNIGMIPFVVSPRSETATITPSQAELLKRDLENTAKSDRGKIKVAGRAIRIDELGFSPQDMDLNAMASIPEERAAAVIGPNAYVLGFIPENSIYTNFFEARRDAYESYLIPLHSYFAEQLTEDLLREFVLDENVNLEYDFSDVPALQDFRAKQMEMWGKAFRDGIATRYTALISTGQEASEEDKKYVQEIEKENNVKTPTEDQIVDGNERKSAEPNKGPVLGGKEKV